MGMSSEVPHSEGGRDGVAAGARAASGGDRKPPRGPATGQRARGAGGGVHRRGGVAPRVRGARVKVECEVRKDRPDTFCDMAFCTTFICSLDFGWVGYGRVGYGTALRLRCVEHHTLRRQCLRGAAAVDAYRLAATRRSTTSSSLSSSVSIISLRGYEY